MHNPTQRNKKANERSKQKKALSIAISMNIACRLVKTPQSEPAADTHVRNAGHFNKTVLYNTTNATPQDAHLLSLLGGRR